MRVPSHPRQAPVNAIGVVGKGQDAPHSIQINRPINMREQFTVGRLIADQSSQALGIDPQQKQIAPPGIETIRYLQHLFWP